MEMVILVNENDVELGAMEKIKAHQAGVLHRAFSILIFNSAGELLIQQRAKNKYHSANLWTNTCCSHPKPGESIQVAAQRRLREEMGIQTTLDLVNKFIYKVELENGLIENELDYVFTGIYDGPLEVNELEVSDWKFLPIHSIKSEILNQPDSFTHWFKIIMRNWEQKAA
jgi:isopentenyl-diphosphate delta-isomerase